MYVHVPGDYRLHSMYGKHVFSLLSVARSAVVINRRETQKQDNVFLNMTTTTTRNHLMLTSLFGVNVGWVYGRRVHQIWRLFSFGSKLV